MTTAARPPARAAPLRMIGPALLVGALLAAGCGPAPVGRDGGAQSGPSAAPKTLRIGMQAQNEPSGGTDGPVSPAPYGGSGNGSPALEHYLTFHG